MNRVSQERHGRLFTITWDETGLAVRASRINPTRRRDLIRRNSNLTFHQFYGFSLGQFHEFFISDVEDGVEIEMAGARVTVADTSPLAMRLFEGDYHWKVHGLRG